MSTGRYDSPAFHSILFETPEDRTEGATPSAPDFFGALNCGQIVDAVTAGRDEYNLKPFFYACLQRVGAIKYRHEVMRDLENPSLLEAVNSFARKMRDARQHLARSQKAFYKEQKQAWFLNAVSIYCDTISLFADDLTTAQPTSRGFLTWRDYLASYAGSGRFTALVSATETLQEELAAIEYCVLIRGAGFTVRKYEGEADYSADVEKTFEKFKLGAVKDYAVKFSTSEDMNHIEAKILEFVAKLHPDVFAALDEFCAKHRDFIDRAVAGFDREVQFYIAYLEYIAVLKGHQLPFCYPQVSDRSKEVYVHDGFDAALAHKLAGEKLSVVRNDFHLKGRERVLVVSGPNQGGKTTFARMFGQLHYLASIGCPVPGREAQLFHFDGLFAHFEKEEKVENLRGKLEDDLLRIHEILHKATRRSVIIMNEIFTSTTIQDETFLSEKTIEKILELDALCVWVTFVDELSSFSSQTVSMVSTVVPDNPAVRTFKVVRRPADGLAYASAIAQKYRLSYASIRERIKP